MSLNPDELEHVLEVLRTAGFDVLILHDFADDETDVEATPQERWDTLLRRLPPALASEPAP